MPSILLALLLHFCGPGKPVIDTNAIDHWPMLSRSPQLSAYGNFLAYVSVTMSDQRPTLTLMARQGTWHRTFAGAARCVFSPDEKQAVVAAPDSLYFIGLGASRIKALHVISYQFPVSGEGRWIAYRQSSQSDVLLEDLVADTIGDLGFVPTYGFEGSSNYLVLEDSTSLEVRDLRNPHRRWVWMGDRGDRLANYYWDSWGQNLAFVVKGEKAGVWNWKLGGKAIKVVPTRIDGPIVFSANGTWLFYLTPTGSRATITTDPDMGPLIRTWQDKD